jgi:hypothetical protein
VTTPAAAPRPGRNPFCLPGLEANPHLPLRWPDHARFHVDADKIWTALSQFEDAAGSGSLVRQGRLVVATGPKGSGKTSLISRCAATLQASLRAADTNVVVVDLRAIVPGLPVPERAQRAARRLIDILEIKGHLGAERMALLREATGDPARLYPQLSLVLEDMAEQDDLAMAILLPAWDDRVPLELDTYAPLVGPRLVFFAESSHPHRVEEWQFRSGDGALIWPLVLRVGKLKKTDCDRFATSRLAEDDVSTAPPIEEVTMEWLDGQCDSLTLERLQKLLHGVYEFVMRMPHPPAQVTRQHIDDYLISHWVPNGGQS